MGEPAGLTVTAEQRPRSRWATAAVAASTAAVFALAGFGQWKLSEMRKEVAEARAERDDFRGAVDHANAALGATERQLEIIFEDALESRNALRLVRDELPRVSDAGVRRRLADRLPSALDFRVHATSFPRPGQKTPSGRPLADYILWIDGPKDLLRHVFRVSYRPIGPSFSPGALVSNINVNGFRAVYTGWSAPDLVNVEILLANGRKLLLDFKMKESMHEWGVPAPPSRSGPMPIRSEYDTADEAVPPKS